MVPILHVAKQTVKPLAQGHTASTLWRSRGSSLALSDVLLVHLPLNHMGDSKDSGTLVGKGANF